MTKTKKTAVTGPTLLVEISHLTRVIVLKRGRLLRDEGSLSLSLLQTRGSKSWIVSRLAPPQSNVWEAAHELCGRLKREFGEEVYVEPDGKPGRYHDLMLGGGPAEATASNTFESEMGSASRHSGVSQVNGLFRPPSAHDFLPKSPVGDFGMGGMGSSGPGPDSNGPSTTYPALATVPGWNDLPDTKKAMFEVEAAQATHEGYQAMTGIVVIDDASRLISLAMQPHISKQLKGFLNAGLANLAA